MDSLLTIGKSKILGLNLNSVRSLQGCTRVPAIAHGLLVSPAMYHNGESNHSRSFSRQVAHGGAVPRTISTVGPAVTLGENSR